MKYAYYSTNLELVRYFNPKQKDEGEFGKGWHLLIPYCIESEGNNIREFSGDIIPEKIAVVNLLTNEREILTFSEDRYTVAGYVPKGLKSSQVVGLFLVTDGSYRLADKLGNEFWFDQAGNLTDMIFSVNHHFHVEYFYGYIDDFEQAPYRVEQVDNKKIEFFNVLIPKRKKLVNLVDGSSELLTFSDSVRIAGYVPESKDTSQVQILALMSDISFQLLDKKGNEIIFTPTGEFEGMIVSSDNPIIRSVSQGTHKVDFKYTVNKSGHLIIASAHLSEDKEGAKSTYVVRYQYDNEGRLCRAEGEATQLAEFNEQSENTTIMARK